MRLLDLFCGAGGAGMGYHRAGFEVVGVDSNPQPHYPFEFHQGDAMTWPLEGFDAIHASPPCQAHTALRVLWRDRTCADLIPQTRKRLQRSGLPYVIENVVGADLVNPVMLCGSAFPELGVRRHRLFECSFPMLVPECVHAQRGYAVGVYGHTGSGANRGREKARGRSNTVADWRRAMGIDWMTQDELAQAIPPAFTEYIGAQLMRCLASSHA